MIRFSVIVMVLMIILGTFLTSCDNGEPKTDTEEIKSDTSDTPLAMVPESNTSSSPDVSSPDMSKSTEVVNKVQLRDEIISYIQNYNDLIDELLSVKPEVYWYEDTSDAAIDAFAKSIEEFVSWWDQCINELRKIQIVPPEELTSVHLEKAILVFIYARDVYLEVIDICKEKDKDIEKIKAKIIELDEIRPLRTDAAMELYRLGKKYDIPESMILHTVRPW